jgi:ABC-2 type transport system permease protein
MKGFLPVLRKELYGFFASPVYYVVGGIFILLAGYFFYSAVAYFHLISFQSYRGMGGLSFSEVVLKPFFDDLSIILLLLLPLLTMRLFAEETKSGTQEWLLTYPLSDLGILFGKYTACLTVYATYLLATLPSMIFLAFLYPLEWGVLLTSYLGLLMLGGGFMALGMFASTVTENQVIAGVLGFGALLLFWVLNWARSLAGPVLGEVLEALSILQKMDPFSKGVLDSRSLVYLLVFSGFFLFLTLRSLEMKRIGG